MDTAEALVARRGQCLRQLVDRQARGVAGNHCIFLEMRQDLAIQIVLPVHALGDRLDDQVAMRKQWQVLIVVGRDDLVRL